MSPSLRPHHYVPGVLGILLAAVTCGNPNRPSGRNIDGVYSLTITSTCASIPAEVRSRTYTATISGSPSAVVTLAGATFWQHPTAGLLNRMSATVTGDSVRFTLSPVPGYGVIEAVGGAFFEAAGSGTARLPGAFQPRAISASLSAVVRHGDDLRAGTRHVSCPASPGSVSLEFVPGGAGNPEIRTIPSIARVEITGPASVAPGGTARLAVMAKMSDGSTRTMADGPEWKTSNPSLLVVAADGTVSGRKVGEANVTAVVESRNVMPLTSVREVVVVPDGTFRVIGRVTERDAPGPVPAATVEVIAAGVVVAAATTDADGRYRLYGVPPDAAIRATREGYAPVEVRDPIASHTTLNFALTLLEPRPDLSGTYRLTIEAGGTCPGSRPLPDHLRQRTYVATVTQMGAQLDVRLSGATFAIDNHGNGNHFFGRVEPSGVTFTLDRGFTDYYYFYYYYLAEYPDLSEQLPDRTVLAISGSAAVSTSPTGMSGSLTGSMSLYSAAFPQIDVLGGCNGGIPHAFTMTRINQPGPPRP